MRTRAAEFGCADRGNRLSLEPERIATEALWDERHSARAWTGIVGFLNIPRDSALQRCDHLALGALKLMPDEPIAFLAAGGVRMSCNLSRTSESIRPIPYCLAYAPADTGQNGSCVPCTRARSLRNGGATTQCTAMLTTAIRPVVYTMAW